MQLETEAYDAIPMHTLPPTLAAEYVRMSTEHQKYSIANQSAAIREYASQKGMQIVRTYTEEVARVADQIKGS